MKLLCKKCGRQHIEIENDADHVCETCGGKNHFITDNIGVLLFDSISMLIQKGWHVKNFSVPQLHDVCYTNFRVAFKVRLPAELVQSLPDVFHCYKFDAKNVYEIELEVTAGKYNKEGFLELVELCKCFHRWATDLPINQETYCKTNCTLGYTINAT